MTKTGAQAILIKVCGLTRADEALACLEAGVDWLGLNFYPPSPRFLTPEGAFSILESLPSRRVAVGLFVDRPTSEVASLAHWLGLSTIQLHGAEPPEAVAELGRTYRVIRAFRLGDLAAVETMKTYLAACQDLGRLPDYALIDAFVPGQPGGTGQVVAEDVLASLRGFDQLPLILAGGLTPENVAKRIRHLEPAVVDVAGGVESAPGRKDLEKVAAFVGAVQKKIGKSPS